MRPAILYTRIRKVERADLRVGILVAYASFEGAHGILRGDSLRAYDIGNLEVEGNIL